MKIYTKKGDDGTTSLLGGTRLSKNNIRIDAYGTLDELNSYLGLLRDQDANKDRINELKKIQEVLFTIGSHLASEPGNSKFPLPEIKDEDILFLEKEIDKMEESLEPMKNFILPGGHSSVSICHICRCICRRAERQVISLAELEEVKPIIKKYLNRLSDYLFVMSRKISKEVKAEETAWKPRE
ncbi:cob(I)yrinic acid a,c-diamide adenosyltransferase [Hyphobacterium sp. CCMP332]|nr:cob(I)yrinic acid a,c-diamide adenosyltransferase [Hyphobacterium sp. CCMP332]